MKQQIKFIYILIGLLVSCIDRPAQNNHQKDFHFTYEVNLELPEKKDKKIKVFLDSIFPNAFSNTKEQIIYQTKDFCKEEFKPEIIKSKRTLHIKYMYNEEDRCLKTLKSIVAKISKI
ncbi:hypothetical protein [Sphingobacterium anhuiense]|uniref:Lipoprotein n=1 Tax=Sphingobacterium anhuiense TaxID=493780 RepID=A0ABW5Z080_9SPHI